MVNDYKVPANLIFRTRDIIKLGGLKCSARLDPQDFADSLESPAKLLKLNLKLDISFGTRGLLALGKLSGRTSLQCTKCLDEYQSDFSLDFEETFSSSAELIDIMNVAKATIALLNKSSNVCSQTCAGLC
ncbi:MAG: hypothetical protein NTW04_04160, partial [Elusimicrobia bacterium]|nr:hypothetical protein [Elusimicrobiota bacterium]